jgi:hypothetical protein
MVAFLDICGCVFGMAAWILQGQDAAGLIPYIVIIFLQLVMLFLKHVWYAVYARGWEGESERGWEREREMGGELAQVTQVSGGNPKSLPLAGFDHIQLVHDSSYSMRGLDVGEGAGGGGGGGVHARGGGGDVDSKINNKHVVDSTIDRYSSSSSYAVLKLATTTGSKCIVGVMAVAKDGCICTTVTHAQQ